MGASGQTGLFPYPQMTLHTTQHLVWGFWNQEKISCVSYFDLDGEQGFLNCGELSCYWKANQSYQQTLQEFYKKQRFTVKSRCKCSQVGCTHHSCITLLQSTVQRPYRSQSTGGAIPHNIDKRHLAKRDPLWGLDCSLLMPLQSLGSLARQVATTLAYGMRCTRGYCSVFHTFVYIFRLE